MKSTLIRLLLITTFSLVARAGFSQNEYYAEIGLSGGGAYYLGDVNNQLFYNLQPSFGGYLRYNIDARLAIRAELNSSTIAGNFSNNGTTIKLNNTVNSLDFCGEFNFFELEQNPYKRYSKTFSPYIFLGIGGMTDLYAGQMIPEISIPFGLGMKLKLANRWNLNVQWSNKLLIPVFKLNDKVNTVVPIYHSDYMEGLAELNDPNGLNGSNLFTNDLLSTFTVGISFDFWKKECKCMNSNRYN